ncbi:rho guanine nucleotide exchange factor 18 isoform X2 [Pangasianodon hypophthalmus]|uniref:rho guanine nucleotide exchange factor 18 isoform X2 n=1 Tax=Pangasianodon hypophthalmus TaxID=310915 RepID=UPI000EFF40DA|nr:rho guanine nucleotide exchange factor 18 isoform X2 [Pangasianodon hypophthalmus]
MSGFYVFFLLYCLNVFSMADSLLNHSWPSFSKFWMKRWSFKRASEGKPCTRPSAPVSGMRASSSPSPDSFLSNTSEDQSSCLVESDFECGTDDLFDLNSSLRDSEYFRDLQARPGGECEPSESPLSVFIDPGDKTQLSPGLFFYPSPMLHCGSYVENLSPSHSKTNLLSDQGETMESAECLDELCMDDLDSASLPILVRSMSTSRRHSSDIPLNPLDLGRRFSLDTRSIDSDGERDDQSQSQSSVEEFATSKETELTKSPPPTPRRMVYSRSEIVLSDEKSQAERVSRILETSKQAARAAGEEHYSDENLRSAEGQCHMANRRTSSPDRKENVTWYEFLSIENEEEEERVERAEKGTKVKRTLSSLRNRVTGSFNKDKGKSREKEQQKERDREREKEKEKEKERERELKEKESACMVSSSCNGHELVRGSFSSRATCSLCSKTLQRKHGLQCVNCAVNVHKSCKSLLPECSNSKNKSKDFAQKSQAAAQSSNQASREPCLASDGAIRTDTGMTVLPRGASRQQNAHSTNHTLSHTSSSSSITGEMDEVDTFRAKRHAEDTISITPSTAESVIVEDAYYNVRVELDSMAQDFEVESWSLAVDQHFLKKHSKEVIKRQDVIYELIQTEMHHVRTLKIMLLVYVHELRETLQLDERRLDCLFPQLESLLELHGHFLSRLRGRRQDTLEPGSEHNYVIHSVADILSDQFSGELGERMKESYGAFCSHHTEAVNYYKEQLQSNKKFQNHIRKINNLSIVRRLGIPECILLVTQRITKYPVLVERMLQYTEADSEEHTELAQALSLIKSAIMHVDAQVSLYEKETRLKEIAAKMEPKAFGKIKDGRIFRREDVTQGRRLLYEGTVNWKAASGRLKDILAVLLTDVLLLLQDKDQRYVFSAVDGKPSVISLQKLIVREVAHEEKAMFLICASSNEPEMYEIHTSSKEERNTWITHIRQAVDSCPHTEQRLFTEEEGARLQRFREIQEHLTVKDAQIRQALKDKLQLYADLAECVGILEDTGAHRHLLLRGDTSELQQGEQLLKGAITEVENLQNILVSSARDLPQTEENQSSSSLPRRAGTFGGYDSTISLLQKQGSMKKHSNGAGKSRERSQRASSDPQLKEMCASQGLEEADNISSPSWNMICSRFPNTEFSDRVLLLSQRLYSLQAIVSQQDSMIELQRASLFSAERQRGTDVLLEQEKQRNLEKHREEMAHFQRVQAQQQQEQERWERDRTKQLKQNEAEQLRLQEREDACKKLEERLAQERQELQNQRQKYQQDLERLRESTRAVEKEREKLEQQRKMKKRHTAPNTATTYGHDTSQLTMSSSFNGDILGNSGTDSVPPSLCQLRPTVSLSTADYSDRIDVPPRRESGTAVPAKTEVPIHLVSATNQLHKQGGVQQQIPTKLATLKSKDKSTKSKGSHRTESSASVDMKQKLSKLSSRETESSVKARRSISPHQQPQLAPPPVTDVHIIGDKYTPEPLSLLHSYPLPDDKDKEDVVFF